MRVVAAVCVCVVFLGLGYFAWLGDQMIRQALGAQALPVVRALALLGAFWAAANLFKFVSDKDAARHTHERDGALQP